MDITRITPGAERPEQYLHLLKGKKTAFIGNQTSSVNGRHTLDFLIENGVEVIKIFGPEHGFRDMADDATPVVDKTDIQVFPSYRCTEPWKSRHPNTLRT